MFWSFVCFASGAVVGVIFHASLSSSAKKVKETATSIKDDIKADLDKTKKP